ncbi:MAG: MBL fold metallo-hydrolase, partial [Eubacteriales bacterium]|nr:MBL fold metallo-hydrolase [Eubacteriales bacterium]
MNKPKTYLRVLGSSNWCPTPGCDSSSFTISDRIMVDTGWYAVPNMLNHALEPLEMPLVLFTHMHADHAMGLPQLLLYWRVHNRGDIRPLTLAGPKEMLRSTYEKAFEYALCDSLDPAPDYGEPTLLELSGGDALEYAGMKIETLASDHAVPGLVYRITDLESGHVLCISGDTTYRPEYGAFFRGCDLLLYECSMGRGPVDPAANEKCRHSSA